MGLDCVDLQGVLGSQTLRFPRVVSGSPCLFGMQGAWYCLVVRNPSRGFTNGFKKISFGIIRTLQAQGSWDKGFIREAARGKRRDNIQLF